MLMEQITKLTIQVDFITKPDFKIMKTLIQSIKLLHELNITLLELFNQIVSDQFDNDMIRHDHSGRKE